ADTRHVPVEALGGSGARPKALRNGAIGHVAGPHPGEQALKAMADVTAFLARGARQVLLVEDDEGHRRALGELIGSEGVQISAVGTGAEALSALESQRFDCAVIDLGLPDLGGLELLGRIKGDARAAELPIIVSTGRQLSHQDELRLRQLAEAIVLKDGGS